MLNSITSGLRNSRLIASSLFAAAVLVPGVASATVWPGRVSDTNVEVSYEYDDSTSTLSLDWIELPPAGLPVVAGDGAVTLTIYNDSGVQMVDIEVDWEALFSADPPATYACSNSWCGGGIYGTCTPMVGWKCETIEAPGSCPWFGSPCADVQQCGAVTCGSLPGDPPELLHMPWTIGPYQPDGSSLFPG